jgi:putative ABC transport system substrate-binding protein
VAVEYRYSGGQDGPLPALVAELVHRPVVVLIGNTLLAMAAKKVTSTIPIVFATAADPVKLGLVASFNRPSRNATGVSFHERSDGGEATGPAAGNAPACEGLR